MAEPSALVLYESALFRDIFAFLLSTWGLSVQSSQTVADLPDFTAAASPLTVVVETRTGDSELLDRIWRELRQARPGAARLYAVDFARDQIVEYQCRRYASLVPLESAVRAEVREN